MEKGYIEGFGHPPKGVYTIGKKVIEHFIINPEKAIMWGEWADGQDIGEELTLEELIDVLEKRIGREYYFNFTPNSAPLNGGKTVTLAQVMQIVREWRK